MKKLNLVVLPFLFILTACGGTQQSQTAKAPKNDYDTQTQSKAFQYDPQGKEEFIFDEVSDILQEFAYTNICFSIPEKDDYQCSGHQLGYDKYVGKRGFYTDKQPVRKRHYILREAILETGEVIYAVTSTKYSHIGDDRLPMDIYKKRINFVPYPIVEGAKTIVTGYSKARKESLKVSNNDDSSYTPDEIKAIQKIASQHPKNGYKIADLLTTLNIDYDDFEGRVIVSGYPFNNKESFISLRIIIKSDGTIIPLVVSHYRADDWLFVENYSVKADDFKWRSGNLKFERDNSSGTIWEWNNSVLTPELKAMLEQLGNADSAIIRFHGKYYNDQVVTEKQQKEIQTMLKILELTK